MSIFVYLRTRSLNKKKSLFENCWLEQYSYFFLYKKNHENKINVY